MDKRLKRRVRRFLERRDEAPDASARPHARLGRAKVAQSDLQLRMEYRREIRRTLSRIKTAKLIPACPEMKFVAGVPGLGNVWQLSQTTRGVLQEIPGLGPARLRKLRAYLVEQNVPVTWEA